MIVLYHRGGPSPCNGPALGVRKSFTGQLAADNVLRLSGSTPKRGDPVYCGTCKQPLRVDWLTR